MFDIPVISVGNISVGGTGKTPHVEYLISLLKDNFRVAVLSRGYKRKSKGFVPAGDPPDPDMIGDEPCQMKRKFPEVTVAVDEDRRNGIRRLLESEKNIDVILLDDAFQHRYVKPGLSVLLIDYNHPLSGDFLLPAGRLREPPAAKKRADIILITKSPEKISPAVREKISRDLNIKDYQKLCFTTVVQEKLLPVFNHPNDSNNPIVPNPGIILVSGIANPAGLRNFAENLSTDITEMRFPDHHGYSNKDVARIVHLSEKPEHLGKILVTSEKDAVRLQKYSELPTGIKKRMFYIPIYVEFLDDDGNGFNKQVLNYVKENKRNSKLS